MKTDYLTTNQQDRNVRLDLVFSRLQNSTRLMPQTWKKLHLNETNLEELNLKLFDLKFFFLKLPQCYSWCHEMSKNGLHLTIHRFLKLENQI
jgi:hypothetical protein